MNWKNALSILTAGILGAQTAAAFADDESPKEKSEKAPKSVLDFKMKDIDGKEVPLSTFKGKTLIIVNVASKCGLTKDQYEGLNKLKEKYKDKNFEILAFPANNFGAQEPAPDKEIKQFCADKKVEFKLFSKISVGGNDIHPLYKFLTSEETNPKFAGEIKWNFNKFLVSPKGKVIGRFEPKVNPMSKEVTDAIEKSMKEKGKVAAK